MLDRKARNRLQVQKAQRSPPPLKVRSHHGGAGFREKEGGGYELVDGSMRPMTQEEIDAL
jgi:hypothetical protein